ncbi:MAG: MotA/TolQ/ExbB proton channel family protein [Gammaproteobacteria bacterium AqS3]|nr:MotA/TolQ/ExbB proton channel family protein [Gammaproteobacteria bacterium AqS3]
MTRSFRKEFLLVAASLLAASALGLAQDAAPAQDQPKTLDELLELVRQGRFQESKELQDREARFVRERSQQNRLLNQIRAEERRLEARADQLERQFEVLAQQLRVKEDRLKEVRGELNEMFGHMESASTEAATFFETSVTRGQYGVEREEFLTSLAKNMADGRRLPSIEEIEKLGFELLREISASGEVARYSADVTGDDGETSQRSVVRIGLFNVIGDDGYHYPTTDSDAYSSYARQPGGGAAASSERLFTATEGPVDFVVDPTGASGGSLLAALVSVPTIGDRIEQGGVVGAIIIALGIIGILLGLWRLLDLMLVGSAISKQVKTAEPSEKNPLGRILKIQQDNPDLDPEALELKLAEGILKERPKIERFIGFIRIIAAVAPLLGLLGTVTGMIITFQAIVLFGTGDPKTMAGGISTALMTTVLGLCAAIPCLLMHTVVNTRCRSILGLLEEQSAGLIAERVEATEAH